MISEEKMVLASAACRAGYCLTPQGKVPEGRMRSMFSWSMLCLPPQGKVPEGRMRSMFSHPAFFIVLVPPSAS